MEGTGSTCSLSHVTRPSLLLVLVGVAMDVACETKHKLITPHCLPPGGVDKMYTYINSTDLRQQKLPGGIQYTIQAEHGNNSLKYNDTLNLVLVSNSSNDSILKVSGVGSEENYVAPSVVQNGGGNRPL